MMRQSLAFAVVFLASFAGCGGDEEVVLSEGTPSCELRPGQDVCTYFATTKPAVRDDFALTIQRTTTLSGRGHDVFRGIGRACENIATAWGTGKAFIDPPTTATLRDACERARAALVSAGTGDTLRVTIAAPTCFKNPTPLSCSAARDIVAATCTSATVTVTGAVSDVDLRMKQAIETNVGELENWSARGKELAAELSALPPSFLVEGQTQRETSCVPPLVNMLTATVDEIRAAVESSAVVRSALE